MTLITECLICHNYKDKTTHKFYTPSTEEREHNYLNKVRISHGYCLPCFIVQLKRDGASNSEIEQMVKSAEGIK